MDEQRHAGLFLRTPHQNVAGSTPIVLELTAGQVVRIENDISTIVYGTDSDGTIHSWFTGHILYLL